MQTIEELSNDAALFCLSIYQEIPLDQMKSMPLCIQKAWATGERIEERKDYLIANEKE